MLSASIKEDKTYADGKKTMEAMCKIKDKKKNLSGKNRLKF